MSLNQKLDDERVREIVVLSGKGGTGKTTVAGGIAWLLSDAVFCDCDVDAANLGLIIGARIVTEHEFRGSRKARIDTERCVRCGLCERHCVFGAIADSRADPYSCEGCGVCVRLCPRGAIEMTLGPTGRWFVSETPRGKLVHARLEPGEENTGKLVSLVRREARQIAMAERKKVILSDGPPGIGCPAISALVNADLVVIVTEPTLSAVHDMQRILEVCRHFRVPAKVCINRYDIHSANCSRIEEQCETDGVQVISKIPFDHTVLDTCLKGLPVTAVECPATASIRQLTTALLGEL